MANATVTIPTGYDSRVPNETKIVIDIPRNSSEEFVQKAVSDYLDSRYGPKPRTVMQAPANLPQTYRGMRIVPPVGDEPKEYADTRSYPPVKGESALSRLGSGFSNLLLGFPEQIKNRIQGISPESNIPLPPTKEDIDAGHVSFGRFGRMQRNIDAPETALTDLPLIGDIDRLYSGDFAGEIPNAIAALLGISPKARAVTAGMGRGMKAGLTAGANYRGIPVPAPVAGGLTGSIAGHFMGGNPTTGAIIGAGYPVVASGVREAAASGVGVPLLNPSITGLFRKPPIADARPINPPGAGNAFTNIRPELEAPGQAPRSMGGVAMPPPETGFTSRPEGFGGIPTVQLPQQRLISPGEEGVNYSRPPIQMPPVGAAAAEVSTQLALPAPSTTPLRTMGAIPMPRAVLRAEPAPVQAPLQTSPIIPESLQAGTIQQPPLQTAPVQSAADVIASINKRITKPVAKVEPVTEPVKTEPPKVEPSKPRIVKRPDEPKMDVTKISEATKKAEEARDAIASQAPKVESKEVPEPAPPKPEANQYDNIIKEGQVEDFVRRRVGTKAEDLQKEFGVSKDKAKSLLVGLESKGAIKRSGNQFIGSQRLTSEPLKPRQVLRPPVKNATASLEDAPIGPGRSSLERRIFELQDKEVLSDMEAGELKRLLKERGTTAPRIVKSAKEMMEDVQSRKTKEIESPSSESKNSKETQISPFDKVVVGVEPSWEPGKQISHDHLYKIADALGLKATPLARTLIENGYDVQPSKFGSGTYGVERIGKGKTGSIREGTIAPGKEGVQASLDTLIKKWKEKKTR